MGRRRLPTEVKELRAEIRRQEKQIEMLQERNAILAQNTDEQFRASRSYAEMQEQIAWYENLLKLERAANVAEAGSLAKRTVQEQMALEDADEILRHRLDDTFFAGITKCWPDAEERSRTIQKCQSFEAQNQQLQKQLDQSHEENMKLVNQIAALRYELKNISQKQKTDLQGDDDGVNLDQNRSEPGTGAVYVNKRGRPSTRTKELCDQVMEAYGHERSIRKVAEKLDLSYSTVQRIIKGARECGCS